MSISFFGILLATAVNRGLSHAFSQGAALNRREYRREYQQFLVRLRAARTSAGLTQVEVAKHLGVPQSFISKCESGERRVDVVELQALAALYKKTLAYFSGARGT
jgi:DNA-binding transcriptional regulator YiaG